MRKPAKGILIAVVILCIAAGIYWFHTKTQASHSQPTKPPEGQSAPVASVTVEQIRMADLSTEITTYGDVVPAPGAIQVVSVPYESMVNRVMVSERQKISRGDPLLELKPSPNTLLELEQAQTASSIARQKLSHVKELFALKLATNSQLLGAQESYRQASAQLENLNKRGVDGARVLSSDSTGLINKVNIQEGAIVPAGNPLIEIVSQNRLEVRLGVEPDLINSLLPGQKVWLSRVNVPGAQEIAGRIRKISRAVNPKTRLVDVFVALPPSAGYMLGEYITGRMVTASSLGLVVPRNAVLPEQENNILFTVQSGHAVKHMVRVVLRNGNDVLISGPGIKAGDMAVVVGNYELKDGMAVKTSEAR